jgi:hypothetical protein
MPGGGLSDRFAGAVVIGDQRASQQVAIDARWEARLMLADQLLRRGRIGGELLRIEVPTAGDAVNVRLLLLTTWAWRLSFDFAFGEALLSLHLGGT